MLQSRLRRMSTTSQAFLRRQRFPSFLQKSTKPPPGLSGNQLIGIFFGVLGMFSISLAIYMDRWMIEEHLSARSGGILQHGACAGKADNMKAEVKKHSSKRYEDEIHEILNKPVATLAGFKGLWRECLIDFDEDVGFHKNGGEQHIGEEKSLCSGQSCECVNYLKSVHSGNVDPVSTTVKALVLTGLSLIIVGVGAGVYGLYCQV